ncbi:uncharacterized protein LOC118464671 isoform X1 [Anopheles albimanus]|uniref:uncharacterized protein LOC118464671 isoform X1 n=1 Tax=Anopheles albimanus TaxID=7167 RepID=UPI00163E25BD|nr:uncharacterized protein LOC118464671 isoform X1 [Anopheles albimanus]XP_035788077.1 uncharacterized protein LOC118464671 isoform X1 [Anopheles albimanus]
MHLRKITSVMNNLRFKQTFITSANLYSLSVNQQKRSTEESSQNPLKYFGSQASRWTARNSRSGPKRDIPWFQPYVVNFSVAFFLIYFCLLREENDIDQNLGRSLFEHVPGLEEKQLILSYHYNKENGLPTGDIELRMTELGLKPQTID